MCAEVARCQKSTVKEEQAGAGKTDERARMPPDATIRLSERKIGMRGIEKYYPIAGHTPGENSIRNQINTTQPRGRYC
jgi:hypothetical protein